MNIDIAMSRLPETDKKVVVSHSGGLDSSTSLILAVEKYGAENVLSLGFDYGQKQVIELERAKNLCDKLGVSRFVIDASNLGEIVKGKSANIIGSEIEMPTIKDVLGDPQPVSYVPHRNMILFSYAAAFAESNDAQIIICGLQATDEYGYWDTTMTFAAKMNEVYSLNRNPPIKLVAPFNDMTKEAELTVLKEIDKLELLTNTLSCYNPDSQGRSCGRCPTCAERIKAWMSIGEPDRIEYQISIPWN